MYENIKRGIYNIGDRGFIYFRSKTEANYALYLQFLIRNGDIINWLYEPQIFEFRERHGTTRYLPDFKIINHDGSHYWVEIKGYMDGKSKTKLRRFKRDYPEEKLELVDHKSYLDIKRKLGSALKFY